LPIPLNWISFKAVFLWLQCAPITPCTKMRNTLTMQLLVTRSVIAALHLLGVAALRNGNLIELGRTTVGVEEACSGVRSLVSCVFAGFFFSAALVRRPSARVLIVVLAAPLALVMNFLRSLTLTLLANRDVDISRTWHDFTGYAVLGLTAMILGGLALLLARGDRGGTFAPTAPTAPAGRCPRPLEVLLTVGLALAVGMVVLFAVNTRRAPPAGPIPDLAAIVPAQVDGWEVQTAADLYRFSGTLQTDHLIQRTYLKRTTDDRLVQVTIYVAYWPAGQAPVSLVASHTPDACWPGAGWLPDPKENARIRLTAAGRVLPPAEYRIFHHESYPQCVWFWHLYDRRPIAYENPYSPRELLRLAWAYGFGHPGPQFFIRISSNREWAAFNDDPLVRELFAHLQPYGL
ncbi:MAG: exosortase/archaeosortase family protein, partial [Opitutaceae bacterium]